MRYPGNEENQQGGSAPGSIGGGNSVMNSTGGGTKEEQKPRYSIPGILHFIQHEWAKFEMERSSWELERAELQARIAFLQGERKGQDNLKNDLVRRIKMLEYALKQERAKFQKGKYGGESGEEGGRLTDLEPEPPELQSSALNDEPVMSSVSWRQGRALLRQYLAEIGYTDTIIDVRSNRVRSLLGLEPAPSSALPPLSSSSGGERGVIGGGGGVGELLENGSERAVGGGRRRPPPPQKKSLAETMMMEAESSVMSSFDFLASGMEVDDDDEMGDDLDDVEEEMKQGKRKSGGDEVDAETEEVLNEFSFLGAEDVGSYNKGDEWGAGAMSGSGRGRGVLGGVSGPDDVSLGELAQLTVNNDSDVNMDATLDKEAFRKTWVAKYTLRSHFDSVRALAFHPTDHVLVTASEDHTLKLWNLQKTVSAKKNASCDVEPLYTFRSHTSPVTFLLMSSNGQQVYSASLDGTIKIWNLPPSNIDPYDSFDPNILVSTYSDHKDAVWGLSSHSLRPHLVSCSADGTLKLWDLHKHTCLQTYSSDSGCIPTAVDFVRDESGQMVVAYESQVVVVDLETKKELVRFDCGSNSDGSGVGRVNRLLCHPTLSLTVTGHEDRHIRFWDNSTGKMVHAMVAHLDSVTSLALDPHGLYLLSGSHDSSVRIWNVESKQCLQEMTAHRKKFDEAIHDVAFHPSKPFIASAGADGLAKVYI